jgi:conjugal transfer pilus assembly protein TraU
MLKNIPYIRLIFTGLILVIGWPVGAGSCSGSWPNPITDVCWTCLFPIRIGPLPLNIGGQRDNGDPSPPLLCTCPAPAPWFIRLGVGISFWEPARVAEVVRTPLCSPTLGGTVLGKLPVPSGTHERNGDGQGNAFYHVHWFQYPLLSWLGMAFSLGACQSNETFDLAYLSEIDPLWDDDQLTTLLNPEAILFANPLAQAACVADSIAATTTGFGLDRLFWCSGSQGSVYPLNGNHATHVGGVDSSLAVVHKHVFKMHRQFLAQDTSTRAAMCGTQPQPILRKSQYKQQMMHPRPQTAFGLGFGAPSTIWAAGREFPYKGEDFSYLIWRKRQCCAF